VHVPGRASALGLALVLAAACASRAPQGLADRFVAREGGRSADRATFDVEPSSGNAREPSAPSDGDSIPVAPIPKISPGPTLESENEELRHVLAELAVRESVDGHRRAAGEYWRVRVFDQADRHLTRAIALRPRDAGLFEERARLWRDAGLLDRALSDAHQAAYLAPGLAEAQNTLGTVLYALGRVDVARERFARAAALSPGAAYAQSNLCFAAFAGGALEQALMACDEALRITPGLDAAQRNRERVEAALTARLKEEKP
jgi:tetratricopeptide (TPR) repeat protein